MESKEIVELCKRHTIFSWSAQGSLAPITVKKAEGIHLWDNDGKRYIDFNSQLMCVNIGHNHPKVVEAIKKQADELFFCWPGGATEPRAKLGKLLSEIAPGPINKFFFTNGGAETNEAAIKVARHVTGRHKILSRYRSYHGGTHGALTLSGDPRRWSTEPGANGFIKVMDPVPYRFKFGQTDEEIVKNNLTYLAEVIDYEGGHNIAAMFIEPVVGTNGIMPPPKGYLEGLRALLDEHGILLVCDEVMAGFGRTGKMWSHQHADITPDIMCMAKGMTSAALPLGGMGLTDKLASYFDENVFWAGLTYSGHAMSLAAGHAAIEVLLEENLVENAAKMEAVMHKHMAELKEKHPSVASYRCTGLFGAIEFQKNSAGEPLSTYNKMHPAVGKLAKALLADGLFTLPRWNYIFCNPPLCITEEQIGEAFALYDKHLTITDEAFEG